MLVVLDLEAAEGFLAVAAEDVDRDQQVEADDHRAGDPAAGERPGPRQGVPREADLVFDVRFLTNPHYDPRLRPMTGLDEPVAARVAEDPDYEDFFRHLTSLLQPLLPRYNQEGKSYLTIAVGCTGGRHRSVFVAETLARWLGGQGYKVGLTHRDLDRSSRSGNHGTEWRPPEPTGT